MKEVRTIPQLSRETSVPQWTIRKLIKDGRLPCLKMGNKFYIEVEAFKNLFITQGDGQKA